ncbi:fatty acyl-AMP ligase [Microcoleus sp. D2_18a_D3]|uniref:fatty acyl-AMP ligase n=1 Tax=Microcoleus sp. D2_18a_D3 TaxID=3055330 RepID=UPI002FD0F6CB
MSISSSLPSLTKLKFANLIELLQYRSLYQPHQTGFLFLKDGETEEASLTYQRLDQQAQSIATMLQSAQAHGERVLLLHPPSLEFISAFLGCLYAGAIAVPVYPPRHNQSISRLQSIIKDCQPKFALTTYAQLTYIQEKFRNQNALTGLKWLATDTVDISLAKDWQPIKINNDQLAFLQYTSGSTGTPKGVMVSHKNLLQNSELIYRSSRHSSDRVAVSWLPQYHDMGLIGGIIQPLYGGFPVILMSPVSFLQKPLRWLQAISDYQATSSGGPNFSYELCVQRIKPEQKANLDLSSWNLAYNGAEPIRAHSLEKFAEAFADCGFRIEAFYPCYGMAESTLFVTGGTKAKLPVMQAVDANALEQNRVIAAIDGQVKVRKLVSCGYTWGDQKIIIVDPETQLKLADRQVGEIWTSGGSVAQGYWNKPEQTAQTFQVYLADTGAGPFLRTGDLGFWQDEELFITGRLKDVIIIRGCNHYPQDIELTVEQSHFALLKPGCTAAFAVEIDEKEQLVVVAEVERKYRDHRQQQPTLSTTIDRRSSSEHYQEQIESTAVAEQPTPFDSYAVVIASIREAVATHHGLQVYAVLLLKRGTIPKTSSGKIQRYACRAGFLTGTLQVAGSSSTGNKQVP